jgi:hypothetical protein
MLRTLVRAAGILSTALLGSAAVLAALLLSARALAPYGLTPAHFLPAEETIALFQGFGETNVQGKHPWLPLFPETPPPPGTQTIAVVRGTGVTLEHVFFLPKKEGVLPGQNLASVGAYFVTGAPAAAGGFLELSAPRLADARAYRSLMREGDAEAPLAYLTLSALPPAEDLGGLLLRAFLLRGATHALLLPGQDRQTAVLYDPSPEAAEAPPPPLPALDAAFLRASFGSAARAWEEGLAELPRETQWILESIAETAVREAFGEHASLRGDVLPLLQNPASVALMQAGTGSTRFLLHGTADDAARIGEQLSSLRNAFAASLPATRIVRRNLQQGQVVDIRSDPTLIDAGEEARGGWQVQWLQHRERETGLVTAVRGREFFLSNDRTLLERVLTESDEEGRETPLRGGRVTSEGVMLIEETLARARAVLPALPETMELPFPAIPAGSVHWSLAERGALRRLTITQGP